MISYFWYYTVLSIKTKFHLLNLLKENKDLLNIKHLLWGFLCGDVLGGEYPLEKGVWQLSPVFLPWTEEPGGLQNMGLQRVGHDWAWMQMFIALWHWGIYLTSGQAPGYL